MPIFSSRRLRVNVTVYDGETIVRGMGTVHQQAEGQVADPGRLPFLGRFFQTQAEDTTRNNLLLFVNTRLVNNDGIPIRRNRGTARRISIGKALTRRHKNMLNKDSRLLGLIVAFGIGCLSNVSAAESSPVPVVTPEMQTVINRYSVGKEAVKRRATRCSRRGAGC
jgi:hypothetical protein